MTDLRAVATILRAFPGSRVESPSQTPSRAPASPPRATPTPPPSPSMAVDFDQSCDYCSTFATCRWVYDAEADEDRVACPSCRVERALDATPDRVLAEE